MNTASTPVKSITKANEGDKIISTVAMIVTLISFGMLFLTLMMGFAMFRFTAPVWPPAGMEKPSLFIPTLSTLIIFLSSLAYIQFEKEVEKGFASKIYLLVTIGLGLLFMASQFIFWNDLSSKGIFVSSGIFASILYSFTWIHAAHIIAGLSLLLWLYFKLDKEDKKITIHTSNVGKFWHFLGIVWLIMFVTIFVL
jgi:cytochrome c oxidase subunit 3